MPLILADRVRDTTTTTGTGTVTLSGTAPTGYQNFSVIGNGNTTYYTINAGSQWEVGIGTYSSTGPTLARNTVLESSNANALVDFAAGTKDVFVTYPSDRAVTTDGVETLTNKTINGSNNTITNVSLTTAVTGTLPVANGGTGVTTSTGTGSVVLNTSPTLVTPILGAASATNIANGLGAVGTPSYTFTGDLNTGMWSPAADTIAFSEGGVEAMRLDASGNVGIGTSNPLRRLDIAGGGFAFTEAGGAARNIHWGDTTNIYPVTITGDPRSGSGFLSFNTNTFGNAAVERMRVNSAGNVGIGVVPGANDFTAVLQTGWVGHGITPRTATNLVFNMNANHNGGGWQYGNNGAAALYIQSDTGHAWFTAGSGTAGNAITFAERLSINSSGNVTANVDFRAPIFYDSANTAYYVDPATAGISANFAGSLNAATNNLAGLRVNASSTASSGGAIAIQQATVEGWTGIFCDYEPFTGYGIWADNGSDIIAFTGETSTGGIRSFSVPSRSSGLRTAFEKFRVEQNTGDTITGRDGYANSSFRAPIFYDSQNTAFFVDPAGTSVTNIVRAAAIQFSNAQTAIQLDNSSYQILRSPDGGIRLYLGGADPANYYDNTAHNFRTRDGSLYAYINANGMHAPIFYDSNNTGFYLDPTGLSFVSTIITAGNITARGDLIVGEAGVDNASYIYMQDADEGQRAIHCNSNRIGFLTQGGGWGSWCTDGGDWQTDAAVWAPIFYDINDSFFYLNLNGYSQVNGFGSVNGSSGVGLNIMGNPSNGAMMAFHRSAAFAINMGLDTDNVFRMGGWSAAANRLQMDMSGNLTMAGNVTAFSDIRLKKDIETIDGALDLVSKMRGVRFTRIENEERNVGVIAQEMLEICPEVVQQGVGDDDTLSVAYGNLVGVLIEAIKELRAEVAELKATTPTITFKGN